MGKGDKRSKKGKIYRGTYGKRRPRKKRKAKTPPTRA
jgi:30S ribosomal protein S31